VHRNSIGNWERGNELPETLAILLELVRVLGLSDGEKRLLLEARYGTASILPLYDLPSPPNLYFVGRGDMLQRLHAQLTASKPIGHGPPGAAQAITGLAGIGKTQAALEYAYRYRESYHDIFWAAADSLETLRGAFVSLAHHLNLLNLRERREQDENRIVNAMKRWLVEHRDWLLILDNVEDLGLIKDFIPAGRQGSVLVTTRAQVTESIAESIEMVPMSEEEGALFLLRRAQLLTVTNALYNAPLATRQACELSRTLGGLPLALDQAGAYILEARCSLADFHARYDSHYTALLGRRGSVPTDHPASVATTFSLAFEQLERRSHLATNLLRLCAFLDPELIPEELFAADTSNPDPFLEPVMADALALDEAITELRRFSLVHRDTDKRTLSLHRLVQIVFRDGMAHVDQGHWAEAAVRAFNRVFPDPDTADWPLCRRYLSNARACLTCIETWDLKCQEGATLLNRAGLYLRRSCTAQEAEPFYQRALAIRTQVLGPEHPDTASNLSYLAACYNDDERFEQALTSAHQALAVQERVPGAADLDVATTVNIIGYAYHHLGRFEEAEPYLERAVSLYKKCLVHEHPELSIGLNNLGALYGDEGKYQEAVACRRRPARFASTCSGQNIRSPGPLCTIWERSIMTCISTRKRSRSCSAP
jgi:tetratricopeptide (TPR) repeat protein